MQLVYKLPFYTAFRVDATLFPAVGVCTVLDTAVRVYDTLLMGFVWALACRYTAVGVCAVLYTAARVDAALLIEVGVDDAFYTAVRMDAARYYAVGLDVAFPLYGG